jgi:CheY-like chemotaxis protein
MSSILVVERDPRYLESIREALASGGWKARLVSSADQAIQSAASEAPELVLVSLEIPGADSIASSFSRSAGGPGVIGLLPERMGEAQAVAVEADELIQKPFGDADLLGAVRRVAALRRQGTGSVATGASPTDSQRLTSHDIFGDVLAEVAQGEEQAVRQRPAGSAPNRPASYEEVQRKLEKTLSGVGIDTRPKTQPAPLRRADPTSADVDALLSKTLSNLDLGRTKTGVRPAPGAPAPAALAPGTPAPAALAPAPPKAPAPPANAT